jgi:hypothetical protein
MSSTLGEAQMSAWIATTLALAVTAVTATTANAESCHPRNSYHCINNAQIIDLNSVSDIAQKVVGEEPISQKRKTPAVEPAASTPYTGPTVGVTSGKPTPTVGYSWSLE